MRIGFLSGGSTQYEAAEYPIYAVAARHFKGKPCPATLGRNHTSCAGCILRILRTGQFALTTVPFDPDQSLWSNFMKFRAWLGAIAALLAPLAAFAFVPENGFYQQYTPDNGSAGGGTGIGIEIQNEFLFAAGYVF